MKLLHSFFCKVNLIKNINIFFSDTYIHHIYVVSVKMLAEQIHFWATGQQKISIFLRPDITEKKYREENQSQIQALISFHLSMIFVGSLGAYRACPAFTRMSIWLVSLSDLHPMSLVLSLQIITVIGQALLPQHGPRQVPKRWDLPYCCMMALISRLANVLDLLMSCSMPSASKARITSFAQLLIWPCLRETPPHSHITNCSCRSR